MSTDYIDTDDATQRLRGDFGSLYDLPDDAVDLADDITAAESTVNAYVGRRYAVPVTNAVAVAFIKVVTLDIFEELAWSRGAGDELPARVTSRADRARKQLRDIADGIITLGGATAAAEQSSGGADAIVVDGNAPQFNRDHMEGF